MKIGVFGGSFDPPHIGHLNMAIALLESHKLDTVLFCPTKLSPFKTAHLPVATAEQRLAMVDLAIRNIPYFSLLDCEIRTEGVSYTIDTIKRLKNNYEAEFFLLLGQDQLAELYRWKNVEELFTLCAPLIALRQLSAPSLPSGVSCHVQSLIDKGMTLTPIMQISSTMIRERLRQRKQCSHLLPHLVLDYIQRHQLYL